MVSEVLSIAAENVATPLDADTVAPESVPVPGVVVQSLVSHGVNVMLVPALTVLPLESSIVTTGCVVNAAFIFTEPAGCVVYTSCEALPALTVTTPVEQAVALPEVAFT